MTASMQAPLPGAQSQSIIRQRLAEGLSNSVMQSFTFLLNQAAEKLSHVLSVVS